jgi:hypothetical protein
MKYRKVRIARSVACGIICVLWIVMWAHSHWGRPHPRITFTNSATPVLSIHSVNGVFLFRTYPPKQHLAIPTVPNTVLGFCVFRFSDGVGVTIPHWLVLLISLAVPFIPRYLWNWRFSLRTLLIATTLVAVGLGMIVAIN